MAERDPIEIERRREDWRSAAAGFAAITIGCGAWLACMVGALIVAAVVARGAWSVVSWVWSW